jgi:hypothetical protein
MYGVDTSPPHYALPSTLDLHALYVLSQTEHVSSLNGNVCLADYIGYGTPAWIQQNGDMIRLTYPTYPYGYRSKALWVTEVVSPITLGATANFSVHFKNIGPSTYPTELISVTMQTDYGSTVQPSESLPVTLNPNDEINIHFKFSIPQDLPVGQHSATFNVRMDMLTTEGWNPREQNQSVTFQVTHPVVAVQTTTENTGLPTIILTQPTTPVNGTRQSCDTSCVGLLIMIFVGMLVIGAVVLSRKKESTADIPPSPSTELASPVTSLDDRVLQYVTTHGGSISVSRGCKDLGITNQQLKDSLSRLVEKGALNIET